MALINYKLIEEGDLCTLLESNLSDGSKVYEIRLHPKTLYPISEKDAIEKFAGIERFANPI